MFRSLNSTSTLRLAAVASAGALMAGCSWLPFGGASQGYGHQAGYGAPHAGKYAPLAYGQPGQCTIPHAQAPIPQGCDPALVTVGLGGFSQRPQFGQPVYGSPQYADAGYGSHVASAHAVTAGLRPSSTPGFRSRLRGSLSLGAEKSVSGDYFDFDSSGILNPVDGYDPSLYTVRLGQSIEPGANGTTIFADNTTYTQINETITSPTISYDDVHSTPIGLKAGLEYFVSPKMSVFANAGYTSSDGNGGGVAAVQGAILRDRENIETRDGDGRLLNQSDTDSNIIRNIENLAQISIDFSDLRRIDLEAGGRYYFEPMKSAGLDRVTPFVGASVGASHYNEQTATIGQQQAFLDRTYTAILEGAALSEAAQNNSYDVIPSDIADGTFVIYEDEWVPQGSLKAGVEWQTTDRFALAFESGIDIKGARDYASSDESGDANVSIPLTVRGSFNF